MTVTLSSQGKPFGAVQESGIAFVTQPVIVTATKAYQRQDMVAYRDHLPLIVGSVAPAQVAAIQSAPTHEQFYPIAGTSTSRPLLRAMPRLARGISTI